MEIILHNMVTPTSDLVVDTSTENEMNKIVSLLYDIYITHRYILYIS